MGSQVDTLGLNSAAVPLLRDLIHARTGLSFEDGRDGPPRRAAGRAGRRARVRVVPGLLLPAEVRRVRRRRVATGHGRAVGARNVLLARDRSDPRRRRRDRAGAGVRAPRGAAADLERPLRERRRAADHCDDAGHGGLVRAGGDRDPRERRAARRRSRAPAPAAIGSARSAPCRRTCGSGISAPTATPGSPTPRSRRGSRRGPWSI